jgi:hypothetical protein
VPYSGRHAIALSRVYSEMFDEEIPKEVLELASQNGRMQDLLKAIDEATHSGTLLDHWEWHTHQQLSIRNPQ